MIGRINTTIELLIDAFDKFYRDEKYCQFRKSPVMSIVNDLTLMMKDYKDLINTELIVNVLRYR